jgi:predicted DNA-binding transcriptional regulator AlpA
MQKATSTYGRSEVKEVATDRVMRINEFCKGLGVGRSTYYKLLKAGKIEPPLRISPRARGHLESYFKKLTEAMKEQA